MEVVPQFLVLSRTTKHAITFWVSGCRGFQESYRNAIDLLASTGQIAGHVQKTGMKYGFLTTYEQTIFLKQEQLPSGTWALFYGDVIPHAGGE